MTDQPKRRGRPPGSPNKPKTIDLNGSATTVAEDWTPEKGSEPVSLAGAGYVGSVGLFSDPIKVILTRQQAFGDPVDEEIVDWPAHWRLPMLGESVQFAPGWGGIVQTIDFDLSRGVPIIRVR